MPTGDGQKILRAEVGKAALEPARVVEGQAVELGLSVEIGPLTSSLAAKRFSPDEVGARILELLTIDPGVEQPRQLFTDADAGALDRGWRRRHYDHQSTGIEAGTRDRRGEGGVSQTFGLPHPRRNPPGKARTGAENH